MKDLCLILSVFLLAVTILVLLGQWLPPLLGMMALIGALFLVAIAGKISGAA